jgi:hypothetical protein
MVYIRQNLNPLPLIPELGSSKMKKILLIALLLTLGGTPAFAASTCYTPAEAEADQGIRIHSELMVIGLNCQAIGARFGDNLYGDYRKFTADHAKLFAGYESTLIDFFKKNGSANPTASLITLRTNYANKISNEAASMRPDIFCSKYAPRIGQAKVMNETQIHKWAATIFPNHPVSYPVCKKAG